MNKQAHPFLLSLFLIGWVTYTFSLFNVGRFSITLMLLFSVVMTIYALIHTRPLISTASACLLLSGMIAFMVAFVSYESVDRTFTHLVQCYLGVGVLMGAEAIDWRPILPRFRKILFWVAIVVLTYGFYQYIARLRGLPFAFLPMTNLQLGVDEGFQRGITASMRWGGPFLRVSSLFPEPGDFGRFMLWVFAVGYGSMHGRTHWLMICMGLVGILLSQSLGAIVGIIFIVVVITALKRNFGRLFLFLFLGTVLVLIMIHFFPQVIREVGIRTVSITDERYSGRFSSIADNFNIILEAPFFGHGIASMEKVAPYNVIGGVLELQLIERGVLGALLFFGPFLLAFIGLASLSSSRDEVSNIALMILIIEIYSFAWKPQIYFPTLYLALGFALSQISGKKRIIAQHAQMRQRRYTDGWGSKSSSEESPAL